MSGERKVIAIELREDEMVVILIGALSRCKPVEGATTAEALADVDPVFLGCCRDGVRALMEYWRGKVAATAGPKAAAEAGLGGSLQ